MKLLVVTDAVDEAVYSGMVKQRFGDVDLVLSCGDLPPYYLEFLVTLLNVPLFYVRGNHDHELMARDLEGQLELPGGCTPIDGKVINHGGLILAGMGGSPRYNYKQDQYSDSQQRLRLLKMKPQLLFNELRHGRACDIFVTHAPPRGVNDLDDPCHRGFPSFRQFLDRYEPQYMVHGHIHLYNRNAPYKAMVGKTTVMNVYPYRVLDIEVAESRAAPSPLS